MKVINFPVCHTCKGLKWVCEAHQDQMWEHDDCGGAGQPCSECNQGEVVEDVRGFEREIEVTP